MGAIKRMLTFDVLLSVGLLLYVISAASVIPDGIKSALGGFQAFGALLIVIAALMALYNKFLKKG